MSSNVYTKNEILQNLAAKGFFVDTYTLDTFFAKWKVEAIFEDEQGTEFYDKNAFDLVLNNLFNSKDDNKQEQEQEQEPRLIQPQPQPLIQPKQPQITPQAQYIQQNAYEMPSQPIIQNTMPQYNNQAINDIETNKLLNSISLSDGTPLMNSIQTNELNSYINQPMLNQNPNPDIDINTELFDGEIKKEKKMGILEGAILAAGSGYNGPEYETKEEDKEDSQAQVSESENPDFDDISLLSESYEAQEKFREYVVSELSKKNVDLTPKPNEFKLDISERTLNMISRSMAKKIVKHVNQLYSGGDGASNEKLTEIQEKNKALESKAKELEDQNKKLRLLLAESNKNLNSYKPSIFGLYKKVPPQ